MIVKYSKVFLIISLLVSIIQSIIPAISLRIMQRIINLLQAGETSLEVFFELIFVYILIDLLQIVISTGYSLYYTKFSLNFDKRIKILLLNKAVNLSLKDYENNDTYDVINRAKMQGGQDILNFYNLFVDIIGVLFKIGTSIIILSEFNLLIIPIIIVFPICKYLYSLKIGKLQYNVQVARTSGERKLWYIEYLLMTGNSFKEVKLYKLGERLVKQYSEDKKEFISQDVAIVNRSLIGQVLLSIGDLILSGILFAYLVFCGINNWILIGDVVTYSRCIFTIKADMESIFGNIVTIFKNALFINLLYEFLDLSVKTESNGKRISHIKNVELKNLSYSYPHSKKKALDNINLKIDKNKIIGFIGRNGAGKSTLLKIIMGYYDDYQGTVLINGIDLRMLDLDDYRSKIGCVFQDFIKYETSLRENVGYGNLSQISNDVKIIEKLRQSGFNMDIVDDGLETILGNWFGKKQLSIGEWQKVAIARASIRDADVYIFDEPDSALDIFAEQELISEHKKLLKDKLGIFISHKVCQVSQIVEEIIVLDEGKVKEMGTHNDLMKIKGLYWELYTLNAEKEGVDCERFV